MSIILYKIIQVGLTVLLIFILARPVNNVSAKTDIHFPARASMKANSAVVLEDGLHPEEEPSTPDEGADQPEGESPPGEDILSSEGEASLSDKDSALSEDELQTGEDGETGESEPFSPEGNHDQPDVDSSIMGSEDKSTEEDDFPSTDEAHLPDDESSLLEEEKETTSENEISSDGEKTSQTELPEQLENEGGNFGKEDGMDEQQGSEGEFLPDSSSVSDVVQMMEDSDIHLFDEQGQPVPMASQQAEKLLGLNGGGLPMLLSRSIDTVLAQENADQLDGGNDGIGQSFIATLNGRLTRLEFAPNSSGTFTLNIYQGNPSLGNIIYTQSIVMTDMVDNTGGVVNSFSFQSVTLNSPVNVTSGQQYSFGVEGVMPAMAVDTHGGGASYTDGDLYTLSGGVWSASLNRDMAFRVYLQQLLLSSDDSDHENSEDSENDLDEHQAGVRAQFIKDISDFNLVPSEMVIQGILSYTSEYGNIVFNPPDGILPEMIHILFWNGSSWSVLPDTYLTETGILGPAVGPGTYVMVISL